jgi:dipeptidyl aminopeptidase/acylaminoacyl peptidase
MRLYFFLLLFMGVNIFGYGQKKSLDTAAFHNWPTVLDGGLSPDGKFTYYYLTADPNGSNAQRSLILKSTYKDWSITVIQAKVIGFNRGSSKKVFLRLPQDSIGLLQLGTNKIEWLTGIKNFYSLGNWIIYQRKNIDSLQIRNIENGHVLSLSGATNVIPGKHKDQIVVQQQVDSNRFELLWIDLANYSVHSFYSGIRTNQWQWDPAEKQLAFATGEKGGKSIYVYRKEAGSPKIILSDSAKKSEADYLIDGITRFSANGKYLLFNIIKERLQAKTRPPSIVEIYRYTDLNISFDKSRNENSEKLYLRSISLENREIETIEEDGDEAAEDNGDFILVTHKKQVYEWEAYLPGYITTRLVRLRDGRKTIISGENGFWFSPLGKWVLYFDPSNGAYKTLDLETESQSPRAYQCTEDDWSYEQNELTKKIAPIGVAGWINGGNSVLVYSRHGLWQLDLTGQRVSRILTNGMTKDSDLTYELAEPVANKKDGDSIFLSGYNTNMKEQGYYKCVLGQVQSTVCLTRGPWAVGMFLEWASKVPAKAENANVFLFRKMTSTSSPNYYTTSDFRNFEPVSDVYPEKDYNWLTTTLVHWKSFDGDSLMGILYKPENFDPKKKYPLIFYYYERTSDGLHTYLLPEAVSGPMNIPYMVSQGYLVFTPDIKYVTGYPGRSACNSVVSAAYYLANLHFVDTLHMGLQGHSYGGMETNYIVTHTSIFAAACEGAGVSDVMTSYNQLREHEFNQMYVEFGQGRMGLSPWQSIDAYHDNSMLSRADKITTPLLILHNWNDEAVDVQQGIAMFSALRRAGKKVWLLQYPGEGHGLLNEINRLDYTQKMFDFFNHYLKGAPDPDWMRSTYPLN